MKRIDLTGFGLILAAVLALGLATEADGEWYVAGQVGPTFADRLANIEGTGPLTTVPPRSPHFDLRNSIMYGAKLGYFPEHGWFGIEADIFHTTPHLKRLEEIPGVHLRVTTVALNLIARYPGLSVQPYAGIGVAWVISRLGESVTTRSDSDVSSGLNLLAGIRFFVTPYVSMFSEYKYTRATLRFEEAFGAVGGFAGDYSAQHLVIGLAYHF